MSFPTERDLTPEVLAMIAADVVRPMLFVTADFPSGTRRVWTGIGDITYSGHTFSGVGNAIGFNTVSETTDTAAKGISAKINGLDDVFLQQIINDEYQGRLCVLELAFWNEAEDTLYPLPDPLWRGALDTDDIEETGETSNATLNAEHRMADILRKREFHYTDRDQQLLHPGAGDTSLNKMENIQDVAIPWGRTQA